MCIRDRDRIETVEVVQHAERLGQLDAGLGQTLSEVFSRVGDLTDAVELDLVRDFLGKVDDLIECMRKQEDVLGFDWSAEGAVRQVVDLMGDVIALVLEISEPRMARASLEQRLAELRLSLIHIS